MTAIIVDTSAVLASLDEAYAEHEAIAAIIADADGLLVVSPMVAAESDYMLFTRLGAAAARQFAADVAAEAYELPEWTAADHSAALDVINRNSDDSNYIGIADAANVVLADRYRTTRLLTLDQRHFRRLRPLWGADHYTLLPYDLLIQCAAPGRPTTAGTRRAPGDLRPARYPPLPPPHHRLSAAVHSLILVW